MEEVSLGAIPKELEKLDFGKSNPGFEFQRLGTSSCLGNQLMTDYNKSVNGNNLIKLNDLKIPEIIFTPV